MTVLITKDSIMKGMALCGLCALFAGVGSAASAQGFNQGPYRHAGAMHQARRAVLRQKAAYARAVANGHYGAAERAHLRAQAIRHRILARREMARDNGFGRDHGYGHRGY